MKPLAFSLVGVPVTGALIKLLHVYIESFSIRIGPHVVKPDRGYSHSAKLASATSQSTALLDATSTAVSDRFD